MPILATMERTPRVLDNHMNQQVNYVDDSTKVFKFEDGIIENVRQVQQDLGVEFDFSKKKPSVERPQRDRECPLG